MSTPSCTGVTDTAPTVVDINDGGTESDLQGAGADTSSTDTPSRDAPGDQSQQPCASDEACDEAMICEAGDCRPGCRFDGACPRGQVCEDTACVDGCRNPSDCDIGHTCRAGQCERVGCTAHSECGGGNRCVDSDCVEIGAANCATDEDCGHRWRCSHTGVCFEGGCLAHPDCEPDQWCRQEVCVARRSTTGEVRFARIYPAHVTDHEAHELSFYGVGGGLFDMDGDRDLDLFLGAWDPETDSPPCLYENTSRDGEMSFAPNPALCGWQDGRANAAAGVDLDADRRHELVVLGYHSVRLERFHPERTTTELLDLLPDDHPARNCEAGAMLATDLDLDGRVDLYIGCGRYKRPEVSEHPNFALRQNASGDLEPLALTGYRALESDGLTLALGSIDLNDDGLLDILIINDGFVPSGGGANHLTSGAVLLRNPPGSETEFAALPFGAGNRAGGSYMGAGHIHIDGRGDHVYVTDYGPNRLVHFRDGPPTSLAVDLGIDLGFSEGELQYAWSALVDDFDRNGLDDLLVTQGVAVELDAPSFLRHRDTLLRQRSGGSFVRSDTEVGFHIPSHEDSRNEDLLASSRGAVKVDLDRDGYLEVAIAQLEGVLKLYEEQPTADNAPDRCTLIPRNRVVPSYGFGYAVAADQTDDWRRRDMQGHSRFGASPWVLTSVGAGRFRFPSGAIVEFDCRATPGPVFVTEPDWIQVSRADANTALVALDAPWLDSNTACAAAVRDEDGEVRGEAGVRTVEGCTVEVRTGDEAVMVRLGTRWVPRWWPITPF